MMVWAVPRLPSYITRLMRRVTSLLLYTGSGKAACQIKISFYNRFRKEHYRGFYRNDTHVFFLQIVISVFPLFHESWLPSMPVLQAWSLCHRRLKVEECFLRSQDSRGNYFPLFTQPAWPTVQSFQGWFRLSASHSVEENFPECSAVYPLLSWGSADPLYHICTVQDTRNFIPLIHRVYMLSCQAGQVFSMSWSSLEMERFFPSFEYLLCFACTIPAYSGSMSASSTFCMHETGSEKCFHLSYAV